MQKAVLTVMSILALAGVAWAEDYVCEDTVLTGKFRRYLASVSATQVTLGTNEACTVVSKEDTPAQRAINLGNPNADPPVLPTVPVKYRKVVSGLVVAMTQGEKDAVDAAIAAEAAARQLLIDEVNQVGACKFDTLAEINAKAQQLRNTLQGDIDGISNIATAKTELGDMMDRLVLALREIARCDFARAKVGR